MSEFVIDKITATASDGSKRCPARIEALLARADVAIPGTGTIPIGKIDLALDKSGMGTSDRIAFKCQLRRLGLID